MSLLKVTFFLFDFCYTFAKEGDAVVIYWDLVIIINFVINFVFLEIIHLLFYEKMPFVKCCISSALSSVMLFAFLLDHTIFMIFKIIGGFALVFIAIKFVNMGKYLIQVAIFYALEFTLVGIIGSFKMQGVMLLASLFIVGALFMIQNFRMHLFNLKSLNCQVLMTINNSQYDITGFMDTGNNSVYQGKPIVFVDEKYYEKSLKSKCKAVVSTIGGAQEIECYYPKKFVLVQNRKKVRKDVYIAFCKLQSDVDCILNVCLLK